MTDDITPARLDADPKWIDWMPGHAPLFRNETPADRERRVVARRARWRRRLRRA